MLVAKCVVVVNIILSFVVNVCCVVPPDMVFNTMKRIKSKKGEKKRKNAELARI